MRGPLPIITGVVFLIVGIVFGTAGRSVAQTIQQVLVTNSSTSAVPVDVISRPFVHDDSFVIPFGASSGQGTFTAPSSGCLELTGFSYLVISNISAITITSSGSLGTSTDHFRESSAADSIEGTIGLSLWISPGATVTVNAQPANQTSGITDTFHYNLQGEVHTCSGNAPTVIRVARASVHPSGHLLHFHWTTGIRADIAGFLLYAGAHRLTAHLIPITHARSYSATVHWNGHGPYTVHVVLKDGGVMVVPARVR